MKTLKFRILFALSITYLYGWSLTPEERIMREREVYGVIKYEEYLDWDEYEVLRIFSADGKQSQYPQARSFAGNKDCTFTKIEAVVIGKEVSPGIYRLLSLYDEDTGELIQIKYGSNLEGEPAVLRFYSGSVKKPQFGYANQPDYYTTQFYRIYIPN